MEKSKTEKDVKIIHIEGEWVEPNDELNLQKIRRAIRDKPVKYKEDR